MSGELGARRDAVRRQFVVWNLALGLAGHVGIDFGRHHGSLCPLCGDFRIFHTMFSVILWAVVASSGGVTAKTSLRNLAVDCDWFVRVSVPLQA